MADTTGERERDYLSGLRSDESLAAGTTGRWQLDGPWTHADDT